MKIRLLCLACVALLVACSSPKVAYKFDYHDYHAGRKLPVAAEQMEASIEIEPLEAPVIVAKTLPFEELSKKEQRTVVKQFKKEIKKIVKSNKPYIVEETKAMDHDLKLAAIFGSVGFVGLLLSNLTLAFAIVGGVALIIGVVFFVKWLIRQ